MDDEVPILAMYPRLLGADKCVTYSTARQALELLREGHRFDAILCDLMMPWTSGRSWTSRSAASSCSSA